MSMADDMENTNHWMPLYLSCIAGASTCLGAAIVFCHAKTPDNTRVVSPDTMSFSLALAGSVMVTVSIISILPECLRDPQVEGEFQWMKLNSFAFLQRVFFFCLGGAIYYVISLSFPEPDHVLCLYQTTADGENGEGANDDVEDLQAGESLAKIRIRRKPAVGEHEASMNGGALTREASGEALNQTLLVPAEDDYSNDKIASWKHWSAGADLENSEQRRAWRVAMLLFFSLLLHNFPEGLAVAASAMESKKLGITVTIGIIIHNIPEGIAIAIPCLAARPDMPFLAFALASLSGLAEPLGALVALFFLQNVSKSSTSILNMENVLAFVAGIMITVALYELFPEANRHTGKGHSALIAGTTAGIMVMVATELYLPTL